MYIRVERSTNKTKAESNTSNNVSSTNSTTTSTKSNRTPHGPSLPSSKTSGISTIQNKTESNESSTLISGRKIKLSSNVTDRHELSQISTTSTTRESPPISKKDLSTTVDR